MRHRKRRTKLSMMTSHRNAMLRNMVRNVLKFQRVKTTIRKAKEARRLVDRVISMGKDDSVASRRRVFSIVTDRDMVAKLFKEIAPLFKDRTGGYSRIIPIGFRRGDGSRVVFLELTEKKAVLEKKPKKAKAKEAHPPRAEDKSQAAHATEPKMKHPSKSKPTLEDEKRAEKAKVEDRKIGDKKNFMKNLRGFFRRKRDM